MGNLPVTPLLLLMRAVQGGARHPLTDSLGYVEQLDVWGRVLSSTKGDKRFPSIKMTLITSLPFLVRIIIIQMAQRVKRESGLHVSVLDSPHRRSWRFSKRPTDQGSDSDTARWINDSSYDAGVGTWGGFAMKLWSLIWFRLRRGLWGWGWVQQTAWTPPSALRL